MTSPGIPRTAAVQIKQIPDHSDVTGAAVPPNRVGEALHGLVAGEVGLAKATRVPQRHPYRVEAKENAE